MALVQKSNARQTTILLITLAIVGIGSLVAYVFLRPSTSTDQGATQFGSRDPQIFNDFGESLYTTPQFKNLHNFLNDQRATETTPTPIPVIRNVNDSTPPPSADLPPNTAIGNPDPFTPK